MDILIALCQDEFFQFVVGVGFIVFCVFLAVKSPFFYSLSKLLMLLSWGFFMPVCLLVAWFVAPGERSYIHLAIVVVFLFFLQVPWWVVGRPGIKELFQDPRDWKLWSHL